jgi:hypothetical protein
MLYGTVTVVEEGIEVEMPLSPEMIRIIKALPPLVKQKWREHGTFHFEAGPICKFDKNEY